MKESSGANSMTGKLNLVRCNEEDATQGWTAHWPLLTLTKGIIGQTISSKKDFRRIKDNDMNSDEHKKEINR